MPPVKKTEPETNLRRSSRSTRGSIKPIIDLTIDQVEISDEGEDEDNKPSKVDDSGDEEVQIVESEESEDEYEEEADDDVEEEDEDSVEVEDEDDEEYEESNRKSKRRTSSTKTSAKSKSSAKKQPKDTKGQKSRKSSVAPIPNQDVVDICYELNEKEMTDINKAFDLNCSADGEELMDAENLKTAIRALGFEPRTDEIQRLLQKFSKSNKINRDGFHKIVAFKLGSTPGKGDSILGDEISRVFNLLDLDKTGLLTLENLRSIAKELNEEITDEELHEMILEADLDGDFKINKQEFYNIMKKTSLY